MRLKKAEWINAKCQFNLFLFKFSGTFLRLIMACSKIVCINLKNLKHNTMMKKTILFVLLAASIWACTSENDKNAAKGKENVIYYTRVWDVVINEGRTNILDSAYTEDAVLHTVPEVKGKANAKAYYENYVTGFSERQFIIKEIFADGDKLVKYWQFKGKHTGTFLGIPATGKSVDVIGTTIVKMKDGKIAEEQDFMDNMVFMQQLGLLPAAK